MSTLGYADDTKLAADAAAVLAAALAAGQTQPLTDATGKPLAPNHPLLARNPAFTTTGYAPIQKFVGKTGGLMEADPFTEATLGAATVSARTVVTPTKPTTAAGVAAYVAALSAVVPVVDPKVSGAAAASKAG